MVGGWPNVSDITDSTPGTADSINSITGALKLRTDYLKAKLEAVEGLPSALSTTDIDTAGLSAPYFGYSHSQTAGGTPIIKKSYVNLDDVLALEEESFCIGLVLQTAGSKIIYHAGKISGLSSSEINNLIVEQEVRIGDPIYLTDSVADAGKGTYTRGPLCVYLGTFIASDTLMLAIDLSDVFTASAKGQVDVRSFDLTEIDPTTCTYAKTHTLNAGTTIQRHAVELNRLVVTNPHVSLPTGGVNAGDYIRLFAPPPPLVPAADYTNYHYPICRVANVLDDGAGKITDIYLDYDFPTDGIAAGPDTQVVYGFDAGGNVAGVVCVVYDAAGPSSSTGLYWQAPESTLLPEWPGNHTAYINLYINGIAQSLDADKWTADGDGLNYLDMTFPPTFYGWNAKIDYIGTARVDRFVKRVQSETDNLVISGTSEEPILKVIPEMVYLKDLGGNEAIKSIITDPITGKETITVTEVVKSVTAGAGLETTGKNGHITLSSIETKRKDIFLKPYYSTATETRKSNGLSVYDLSGGNAAHFETSIPIGSIDKSYYTTIWLLSNFTAQSSLYPILSLYYNIMGEGASLDAQFNETPLINTASMTNIGSLSKIQLARIDNSNLYDKLLLSMKLIRGSDSYPGSIYMVGIIVDFYT